jgi:hypothetical protein
VAFQLTVNPLLNSAGRHAHEIRLRLADRNGIADLELPFPQPRLYLGKAEFNTPAVHFVDPPTRLQSGYSAAKKRSVQNRTSFQLVFSRNDPPRHRQRLSYDHLPRSVRAAFDNVLISVAARGAFEGAQVDVGFRWFDSRKMHHRATFCAG